MGLEKLTWGEGAEVKAREMGGEGLGMSWRLV